MRQGRKGIGTVTVTVVVLMKRKKALKGPLVQAFAKRLEAHRVAGGYELAKEFADKIGVNPGAYGRWERAETEPGIEMIILICTTLGITPNRVVSLPPAG